MPWASFCIGVPEVAEGEERQTVVVVNLEKPILVEMIEWLPLKEKRVIGKLVVIIADVVKEGVSFSADVREFNSWPVTL